MCLRDLVLLSPELSSCPEVGSRQRDTEEGSEPLSTLRSPAGEELDLIETLQATSQTLEDLFYLFLNDMYCLNLPSCFIPGMMDTLLLTREPPPRPQPLQTTVFLNTE